MTTTSDINNLVRSASNRISYESLDQKYLDAANGYLTLNITKLGKVKQDTILGYTAITQDIDYPDQLVFGTSVAVFDQVNPAINNVLPDLSKDFSSTSWTYDEQYDGVNGADPAFSSVQDQTQIAAIIAIQTGRTAKADNPHRMVIAGTPKAAHDHSMSLNSFRGPYPGNVSLSAVINDLRPPVAVTDREITTITNAISDIK